MKSRPLSKNIGCFSGVFGGTCGRGLEEEVPEGETYGLLSFRKPRGGVIGGFDILGWGWVCFGFGFGLGFGLGFGFGFGWGVAGVCDPAPDPAFVPVPVLISISVLVPFNFPVPVNLRLETGCDCCGSSPRLEGGLTSGVPALEVDVNAL